MFCEGNVLRIRVFGIEGCDSWYDVCVTVNRHCDQCDDALDMARFGSGDTPSA